MATDREFWSKEFTVGAIPAWMCPTCEKGNLVPTKDKIHCEETARSHNGKAHDAWDFDWIEERASGVLICQNSSCKESIAFCLKSSTIEEDRDEEAQQITPIINFQPVFFDPPLHLFKVHKNCPETVQAEIEKAFQVFWCDFESCANRIRSSIELILNERKVKKMTINKKGKKVRISLHDRILNFGNKQPEIAKYMSAVKWIGNAGSHSSELQREDIYDGLDLVEYVIDEIYGLRTHKLKKLAAEVNKKNGPRTPKRKSKKFSF